MAAVKTGCTHADQRFAWSRDTENPPRRHQSMWDLLFIGITLVVFAVLALIVKGVEHLESWELGRFDRRGRPCRVPGVRARPAGPVL